MRSTKTRDGIAASLADNVGYLEELYYGLEEDTGNALDAATAASTAAAAAIADVESGLTEMDSILESLSLARASRLNRPNLLKQNYSAGTWAVASGTVVKDVHEIAAEDATAAANAITYTVTNAAITANSVIHAKYSSDYAKDFAIVLLAVAGLIVLIGNVIATVKGWRKPHEDMAAWRKTVDKKLETDNERLKSMEAGNKVICRGILAMLSHEINGNSIDKLKASQTEMTNYLIDR